MDRKLTENLWEHQEAQEWKMMIREEVATSISAPKPHPGTGKIRREETGMGTNVNSSRCGTMVVEIRCMEEK